MELKILQIDLARQKETFDYIKSYVDLGHKHGYNAILIYLENAVRTSKTEFFNKEETYSLSEMKEVVDYIKSKGMMVIPAFENLGHLEKFFLYPELHKFCEIHDGTVGRGYEITPEVTSCGCTSMPEFYEFFNDYIKEVMSIFPDKYVHMGLDEPFDFAICKKCQERIKNGETKNDLFLEHIVKTHNLIKSLGKEMMMWDDFFEYANIIEKLPRDIIMCNWNYSYVLDEPAGHWINRIKDDRFRLYDKLGFRYIFCVYASRSSSTFNLESMTNYAMKYKPMGALMTAWARQDSFYLGAYPYIALGGEMWNDKIKSKEDAIKVYSQYLTNEKVAKAVYDIQVVTYYGHTNVDKVHEKDSLALKVYRDSLRHFLDEVRPYYEEKNNDVLIDLYNFVLDQYQRLELENIGSDIFTYYQTSKGKENILSRLDEIALGYKKIREESNKLWQKYRPGILSTRNAFDDYHNGRKAMVENVRNGVLNTNKCGILYFDTMLHDGYCTVKAEIKVKYKDEKEETVIYNGGIKNNTVAFDLGGCYGFEFKIEPKEINYLILSVYSEGSLYPLNIRYLVNNEKYIASEVSKIEGNVKNEQMILLNDTQFAEMGCNDGIAHFNDIELSRKRSSIKVEFKKM